MEKHLPLTHIWGSTAQERALVYPCDQYLTHPDGVYYRAVTVNASSEMIFRWLCQLRVAPYSYDWLDNGGRQSPRNLTPGLEQLAAGQRFMTIFRLLEFKQNCHITLLMDTPQAVAIFGKLVISYMIISHDQEHSCRLIAKLQVCYPQRLPWSLMQLILPWGDFIMMRKQLLTLKRLAEGTMA